MSAPTTIITKYRPAAWDEVLGHDAVIAALKRTLASPICSHAFLMTGPAGIGKTTIARLIGQHFKAEVIEIDAASNSGVDAMREVVNTSGHMSLAGSGKRIFILDECHRLSPAAWDVLLKTLEEPPDHLFFALCTTDLSKIRDTIITRCYHVVLRALSTSEIQDLVLAVAAAEEWEVTGQVLQAILQAAMGSPRKALSILEAVHGATSRDEVKRIISLIDAGEPLIELCQHLIAGKRSWKIIGPLLGKVDDDVFEQAALLAGRYIGAAMLRADTEDAARRCWYLLDALLFPSEAWDKKTAFQTAIGRMLWAQP